MGPNWFCPEFCFLTPSHCAFALVRIQVTVAAVSLCSLRSALCRAPQGARYQLTLQGPFAMFSTILGKIELCEGKQKLFLHKKCGLRNNQ